ncbi:MAG: hypothetical protein GYA24_05830 [Candidatus Lokiarchaeota archaeon]|nr:hypothetical protein [Candidatus Lokiarchaeota archaeon]
MSPQPALFNGTINGIPVRSFEGDVVVDATPRYLLLKLKIDDAYWMMDLTEATNTQGSQKFTIVLKKHDGNSFSEHYSGETTQQVFMNKQVPTMFGFFKATMELEDRAGKKVVVRGDFLWDTSRFPKGQPASPKPAQVTAPERDIKPEDIAKLIVGKWKYLHSINEVGGMEMKVVASDNWVTEYRPDGTYTEIQTLDKEYTTSGRYTINGNVVTKEGLSKFDLVDIDATKLIYKCGPKQVWERVK